MKLAFSFTAITSQKKNLQGTTVAPSSDAAYANLRRFGMRPVSINFNLLATIGYFLRSKFDARELARLYRTLGQRIKNGNPLAEGLNSASEFLRDGKLVQACLIMRQMLLDGTPEYDAMTGGGFPYRDCQIIRAASKSGKSGDAYESLAEDVLRVESLRASFTKIFRMPKVMFVFMCCALYPMFTILSPKTIQFIKNQRVQLDDFLTSYFGFITLFNNHLWLSTLVYIAVPSAFWWFLHSNVFKLLIDEWKLWRDISVKTDQSSLWSGYKLLLEAGVSPTESANIMKAAANRTDSADCFEIMGRILKSGTSIEQAVVQAQFPKFVSDGINAAAKSGNLIHSMGNMVKDLEEDARIQTELLTDTVQTISLIGMAFMLMLYFYLSYYPTMSMTLKNL